MYHLIRGPKARLAGSSASYHLFALVTDAGFIPFYVFTIIMARRNLDLDALTRGRWRTMFPTDGETDIVLMTTWLTCVVVASLHLVSAGLSLYMALVFKKISNLPADMNPLEDNLTSRRKTKHKHKNSSMSAITPLTSEQAKRFSGQSTIAGDRNSQTDSLLYKDVPSPDKSQVAFLHTRTDSGNVYSPHTPASARQSKEQFSMYSQPASAYQSRKNFNHGDDLDRDDDDQTLAQRRSMLSQQANMKRHSRADSYVTNASKQDFSTAPGKQEANGDLALQRNSRETLQQDNWFVHPEDNDEQQEQYPAKQSMLSPNKGYHAVSRYDEISDLEEEDEDDTPMIPQPLRMNPLLQNPPTPPPPSNFEHKKKTPPPGLNRTMTTTSISTEKTFDRSHSRSGNPKSRYYGDLKAATDGVRNGGSPANSPSTSPTKNSFKSNNLPSATKQYSTNMSPPPMPNQIPNSPFSLHKKSYTSIKRTGEANYTPVKGQSPRVISRSGVDYINPYEFDDSDLGTAGRRRDVSGKIAEEGRGGGWSGMTQRKVSGMA
jgi:hypothetical protein